MNDELKEMLINIVGVKAFKKLKLEKNEKKSNGKVDVYNADGYSVQFKYNGVFYRLNHILDKKDKGLEFLITAIKTGQNFNIGENDFAMYFRPKFNVDAIVIDK